MLLFFALALVFNLCVGYVLGAYFGFLPGAGRRWDRQSDTCKTWFRGDRELPFALGDPEPFPTATQRPNHIVNSTNESVFQETALTDGYPPEQVLRATANSPSLSPDLSADSPRGAAEAPTLQSSPKSTRPAADATGERDHSFDYDDYVAVLTSYQHDIDNVDQQLRGASDEATVERCAAEMTTANNRYVVQSKQACEGLELQDDDSPALTEEKLQFRQSISSQARHVMHRSEEIRAIDVRSDPAAARCSLLEVTSDLSRAASQLQQELKEIFEQADLGVPPEPAGGTAAGAQSESDVEQLASWGAEG